MMELTSLDKKISELFSLRLLPWMSNELECPEDLIQAKLVNLQKDIFYYDQVLEDQSTPDQELLAQHWAKIRNGISQLGYDHASITKMLSQISIYAQNELSTREGIRLSNLPLKYFYYYKSCDVRLMRRIMTDQAQRESQLTEDHWLIFDWVTEMNDDICDLEEDVGTFNGNRYLNSLQEKGMSHTKSEYIKQLLIWRATLVDQLDHFNSLKFQIIQQKAIEVIEENKRRIEAHESSNILGIY